MDKDAKLWQKYNQPNAVVILTTYPPKGGTYAAKISGVSSFAKNTAVAYASYLKLKNQGRVIVVCETLGKEEMYEEDDLLVVRVFNRNQFSLYPRIWQTLHRFSQVKKVLVEFEFALYGDFWVTSFYPFFLWSLKFCQKEITLVIHQVIFDLAELVGHIGLKKQSLKMGLFNQLIKIYYFFLTQSAQRIIVLEEELKKRLSLVVSQEKIQVISHGVDAQVDLKNKEESRKKLGLKPKELAILYFGYLTWYKGADFLVKAFPRKRGLRLILAGGASATQKNKPHYQKYLQKLSTMVGRKPNVKLTGFVPSGEVATYFAACDLVVLPYRTFMSSSGPLSLAFSYGKPFLLSRRLISYTDSADFKVALAETGLKNEALFFSLNNKSLTKKIEEVIDNKDLVKLACLSRLLAQKRDFSMIIPRYDAVINDVGLEPFVQPEPELSSEKVLS